MPNCPIWDWVGNSGDIHHCAIPFLQQHMYNPSAVDITIINNVFISSFSHIFSSVPPQTVGIHISSSLDWWAHLMRCYRVHVDQILVCRTIWPRDTSVCVYRSKVELDERWRDWPAVSLRDPLSLVWSPWSEPDDHCIIKAGPPPHCDI